jgi:signal peptidase I
MTNNEMEKNLSNFWKETVKLIFISLLIVVPFRLYIAQPFIVDGASMSPTFGTGDYLIVDEVTYRFNTPARGSIVIFRYPKDTKKIFIKRVIGLPTETVSIYEGQVKITNTEHPEGLVLDEPYVKFGKKDNINFSLGRDEYFVLGDNRLGSADSRIWGAVPEKNIIGRPILRFFPPAFLPGDYSAEAQAADGE